MIIELAILFISFACYINSFLTLIEICKIYIHVDPEFCDITVVAF